MTTKAKELAGAIALAALLCSPHLAGAAELGTTYESILAGAKQEGKLEAWILLPSKPETHRALIDAFNKKYGLNTQVTWVPTSPVTALTKTVAEAQGGHVTVDIISGSEEEVSGAIKAGIISKFEWSKTFASEFPGFAELESKMMKDYVGYAVPYLDFTYGIAWNPNNIDEADVPSKLTDLADPKWQGKVGFNSILMIPIPVIGPFLGADESIDLAKKIFANKPVFSRGTPAVAQSVVNGAVPIGVTGFPVAETSIRNGEPLKFKLLDDFVPSSMQHLLPLKNSPNPNTAVLFTAWYANEGYKVGDQFEPTSQPTDPDSKIAKMTSDAVTRGAVHAVMQKVEDLETTAKVREGVSLIMSGQN